MQRRNHVGFLLGMQGIMHWPCNQMHSMHKHEQELVDPITLGDFVAPVLASDGYTYSMDSLKTAMEVDCWHRSPVTGEVLRPKVFSNVIVANHLGIPAASTLDVLRLFSDTGELCQRQSEAGGRQWTFSLPRTLQADAAVLRVRFRIPAEARVILKVRVTIDNRGQVCCMHAPCAFNLQDRVLQLLDLFGIRSMFPNPYFGNALLSINGKSHFVEEWIWNTIGDDVEDT